MYMVNNKTSAKLSIINNTIISEMKSTTNTSLEDKICVIISPDQTDYSRIK
jgi:hypothetical protein